MLSTQHLSERLSEAIGESPKTGVAIAAELGVDDSLVSKWKKKRSVPTVEHLYKLPGVLGVRAEWLFLGEEPRRETDGVPSEGDAVRMLRAMRTLLDRYPPLSGAEVRALLDQRFRGGRGG